MAERLRDARRKVVGIKETTVAVESKQAAVVYYALDADGQLIQPLKKAAERAGVDVVAVESRRLLGRLSGIQVGAAVAALLK